MCFSSAGEDDNIYHKDFFRVCDCNNGKYVTTLTQQEIEYIFDVVTKHNVDSGDFISFAIAEDALSKLQDLRDYVSKPHSER